MKNKKLFALATCAAVTAMLAGNTAAYAATSQQTTVKATIVDTSSYYLEIPANTTVTGYGWTELKGNLKVTGTLADYRYVNVTIQSANDFKFVNAKDDTKTMAYTLSEKQYDSTALTGLNFYQDDLGDEGKSLCVNVSQAEWNNAPGGTYSDVLTFVAATKISKGY